VGRSKLSSVCVIHLSFSLVAILHFTLSINNFWAFSDLSSFFPLCMFVQIFTFHQRRKTRHKSRPVRKRYLARVGSPSNRRRRSRCPLSRHHPLQSQKGCEHTCWRLVQLTHGVGPMVQRRRSKCMLLPCASSRNHISCLQFRVIPSKELPPEFDSSTAFTSVCINTPMYLSWLVGQIIKNGGIMKRGIVKHVNEAANLHHSGKRAQVVINCTGLSSLTLGGVEDKNMYPARGQIVVVGNDPKIMTSVSGTDDGPDEATYIMHRAAGTPPSSISFVRRSLVYRRRHNPRRLPPKAQLGIPTRSKSRNPDYEALRRSLPSSHRRERNRTSQHYPPCCWTSSNA
jgi:hypothetical protein